MNISDRERERWDGFKSIHLHYDDRVLIKFVTESKIFSMFQGEEREREAKIEHRRAALNFIKDLWSDDAI